MAHYLKYRDPEWHQSKVPYPKGRDPQRDLFKDDFFTGLAGNAKGKAQRWRLPIRDFRPLQADLRLVAEAYLSAALKAPLGLNDGSPRMSNDQRLRALRSQVVSPAQRLLGMLEKTNNPVLSEFPEMLQSRAPDKRILVKQLKTLLERVDEMIETIEDRSGSHTRKELQHELANALADVFERHFPSVLPRRHYEERWPMQYEKKHQTPKERDNEFAAFVRACSGEIFPKDKLFVSETLDDIANSRHG